MMHPASGRDAAALSACDLPASALIVEVTESDLMSDPVRIGEVLARLRASGIELSLDDFGTGYSSLMHLRTFPVSEVKIDRSFVAGMAYGGADLAIVRSTIQLAHELGLRVVGEGVEDDSTWRLLDDLGCEIIQGYFFSRPAARRGVRSVPAPRRTGHGRGIGLAAQDPAGHRVEQREQRRERQGSHAQEGGDQTATAPARHPRADSGEERRDA
jgi:diguanylate cyclase